MSEFNNNRTFKRVSASDEDVSRALLSLDSVLADKILSKFEIYEPVENDNSADALETALRAMSQVAQSQEVEELDDDECEDK